MSGWQMSISVYDSVEPDGPGVNIRSRGPTVGHVYCQHVVVIKDGAINDHHRGASVSIDAATPECTPVQKTGRTDGGGGGGIRIPRAVKSSAP